MHIDSLVLPGAFARATVLAALLQSRAARTARGGVSSKSSDVVVGSLLVAASGDAHKASAAFTASDVRDVVVGVGGEGGEGDEGLAAALSLTSADEEEADAAAVLKDFPWLDLSGLAAHVGQPRGALRSGPESGATARLVRTIPHALLHGRRNVIVAEALKGIDLFIPLG